MLEIGTIVDGKYQILEVLGRGGTSCVFLAENIRIQKKWAIKEVYKSSAVGMNGGNGGKLIAESKLLTKLRHPGLPDIVDVIETETSYLVVMEFIEGVTLEKVVQEQGPQSEEMVVRWGKQLCDVLQYLHNQQPAIIYRDMKPANIMLKPDGDVVLIDFGIAREFNYDNSHDTTHLGTHGYAAPEQYNNTVQSDARTDVYGLGMTLYRLITGQDPCVPPYGIHPIRQYNSSASKHLERVIRKCTELEQNDRYQTALLLKADLEKKLVSGIGIKIGVGVVFVMLLVAGLLFAFLGAGTKKDVGADKKSSEVIQEDEEDTKEKEQETVEDDAVKEDVEESLPSTEDNNSTNTQTGNINNASGNTKKNNTDNSSSTDIGANQPNTSGTTQNSSNDSSVGGTETEDGTGTIDGMEPETGDGTGTGDDTEPGTGDEPETGDGTGTGDDIGTGWTP